MQDTIELHNFTNNSTSITSLKAIADSDIHQHEIPKQRKESFDIYSYCKEEKNLTLSSLNIHDLKEIKSFKRNTKASFIIHEILLLEDDKYATCSDQTIRIWSFNPAISEKTLIGHTDSVRDIIKLVNGKLASASEDGKIKIWNLQDGNCEMTLEGHTSANLVVELLNDKLISGGTDGLRIWNLKQTNGSDFERALTNITYVSSIAILNKKQMAVAYGKEGENGDIKIYEIFGSDTPTTTLRGHSDAVTGMIVVYGGQTLISSSFDFTVIVWNVLTGSRVRTFSGTTFAHNLMRVKENIVAASYADSQVIFWNVHTGECVKSIKGYSFGLAICENGDLISCGTHSIKFWSN